VLTNRLINHPSVIDFLIGSDEAPPPARYALHSEQGQVLLDFSTATTRQRWTELFEARRAHWIDMLRRRSLRWTMLDTHAEPELALRTLLGQAARGRGAA
jgi:hypothetical protein